MHYDEPSIKRTIAFIDGQSLYFASKEAFGYHHPNYDVKLLAEKICSVKGWQVSEIHFYTGIPDARDNVIWHNFWINKLTRIGQDRILIFTRPLRYHNVRIQLPDGRVYTRLVGQEKGIDVRIALDVIRFARENTYDIALIFSQDQDLSEVADEIRIIANQQNRWIKIVSAFPVSPTYENKRGIDKTDWIEIDKATYDSCIDPNDYRNPIITPIPPTS